MARSCTCSACGATIRPRDRDMSLSAAVRLHYWRKHREIMLGVRGRKRRKARSASLQ